MAGKVDTSSQSTGHPKCSRGGFLASLEMTQELGKGHESKAFLAMAALQRKYLEGGVEFGFKDEPASPKKEFA